MQAPGKGHRAPAFEQMQVEYKIVDYVVCADEGHDVLKYVNKVDCYNRIVDFFAQHLGR